jgi:ribonuclease P protein component
LIDRVRERDAFLRLRRDGVRVRTNSLWCSFVPDPKLAPPQVAFAIGRAVGSAVQRNRLRRRLRAILAASDVPPGLYLFGAHRATCERTFVELEQAVATLISQVARHPNTVAARSSTSP